MAPDRVVNLNFASTSSGLAAGTTTTITIGNDVHFSIGGKSFRKAAASNQATPTTDAVTGVAFKPVPAGSATDGGYGCAFVVCLDSAGAIRVVQSDIVRTEIGAVASSKFTNSPGFPAIPDNLCPIGYVVTKSDNTASAWTFGVSNLAGPPTGILHTFVSSLVLPSRPFPN